LIAVLDIFLVHFGCKNGANMDARGMKKTKKIPVPFWLSFSLDFGAILVSFATVRTVDFIGRGGEFAGCGFGAKVHHF
jgi:hypothetical protein